MKKITFLFVFFSAILTSCTIQVLEYTSSSSAPPVSSAPNTLKEKNDLEIKASMYNYNSSGVSDNYLNEIYSGTVDFQSIRYIYDRKLGAMMSLDYALSNNLGIGIRAHGNFNDRSKSFTLQPSVKYFDNFKGKKNRTYGYGIEGGIQYTQGNNFLEVDSSFFFAYLLDFSIYPYLYNYYLFTYNENFELSYFNLNEKILRTYVRPTFTFENRYFEFHVGGALGYAWQAQYKADFQEEVDLKEIRSSNPLLYYQQNKHFVFGEMGISWGVGPEYIRFIVSNGFHISSNRINPTSSYFQAGLKSNFNIKSLKKKEVIIMN
jgi:hypothetical protein